MNTILATWNCFIKKTPCNGESDSSQCTPPPPWLHPKMINSSYEALWQILPTLPLVFPYGDVTCVLKSLVFYNFKGRSGGPAQFVSYPMSSIFNKLVSDRFGIHYGRYATKSVSDEFRPIFTRR
jgi:hypothetical protein